MLRMYSVAFDLQICTSMKNIIQFLVVMGILITDSFGQNQSLTSSQQLQSFRNQIGLSQSFSLPARSNLLPSGYQPLKIGNVQNRFACVGEALSNQISLLMAVQNKKLVKVQTNEVTLTTSAISSILEKEKIKDGDTDSQIVQLIKKEKTLVKSKFQSGEYEGADPYFSALFYNNFHLPVPVTSGDALNPIHSNVFIKSYFQYPSMESMQDCSIRAIYEVEHEDKKQDGASLSCEEFQEIYNSKMWSLRLKNPEKIIQTLKQIIAEKKLSILASIKTDAYQTNEDTGVLSDFQEGSIGHAINIVDYDQQYFYIFDSWSDKKLKRYKDGNRIYKIKPDVLINILMGIVVVKELTL